MKKTMRGLALALAMVMALSTTAFAGVTLPDINGSIYKEAIETLVEEGVVTGDTDGKFHPEKNLTRAEACIMIVKTVEPKLDTTSKTTKFTDMAGYDWAAPYIAYAAEHGIVVGYPGNVFKPGEKVTTVELLTMLIGAAGYADEVQGTWPQAQIDKAKEVGILDNLEKDYPSVATKGMAAQMIVNKIADMRPVVDDDGYPGFDDIFDYLAKADLKFADASFDATASKYNDLSIAKNVKVYAYGVEKEYSKTMQFSGKRGDYYEETIHKYRNADTKAWYVVEGGKITMMLVPRDAGFSGRAYCVINGTVTTLNSDDKAAVAFETLTATKEITWIGKEGLNTDAYDGVDIADGILFELQLRDGEVINVATVGGVTKGFANEITNPTWTTVAAVDSARELINIAGKGYYEVNESASVYVWNDKENVYEAGKLSSIRKDDYVRLYDITDDKHAIADIILVKEN